MEWKTWTRFTAVVLFLITVGTFYFTYLNAGEADVIIQTFPSATDLDSLENDEDISFSFFLYNQGDGATVIDRVLLYLYDEDGNELTWDSSIGPHEDFALDPGITPQEVEVILSAPGEDLQYYLYVEVYYEDKKITSDTVPVLWGGFLE